MFALEIAGNAPLALQALWFILIAVLWIGYLVLEGFDYGVGILLPFLGKTDGERRRIINTIGPVWDGNEVWILTGGGPANSTSTMAPCLVTAGTRRQNYGIAAAASVILFVVALVMAVLYQLLVLRRDTRDLGPRGVM